MSRSVLLSRKPSPLHDADVGDGVVAGIVPVEDDLRDLHVGALDRDLRFLDILLLPMPLFGSDLRAWIGALDRLLAQYEPLVGIYL